MAQQEIQTSEFLKALHRGGKHSYWWTPAPRRSSWWHVETPTTLPNGRSNVYVGVHPVDTIPPTNAQGELRPPEYVRSQVAYITAVNCLFAEFDAKDFAGDKDAAYRHVEQLEPTPSIVIDSGGGYHCYWLLDETWYVHDEAERKEASKLQADWVEYVKGDDASKDLARVLRVPGTMNYKYNPAREVQFARCDLNMRYTRASLKAICSTSEQKGRYFDTTQVATSSDRNEAYVQAAFASELAKLASATEGHRNKQLNKSAFNLGQLIAGGLLAREAVEAALYGAAKSIGLSERETLATIKSGIEDGMKEPRGVPNKTLESGLLKIIPESVKDALEAEPDTLDKLVDAHYTDVGNAECMILIHGDQFRFCHTREKWRHWDGTRWQVDDDGEAKRAALDVIRARQAAALTIEDVERKQKAMKACFGSESAGKLSSMLQTAAFLRPFATTVDLYDRDPMLVTVANGTLDLRSGELRPSRREDYITMQLGTAYTPDADCPRWKQFLQEVFADDQELIAYIQRAVGYSLTGNTNEQKLFLCHGGGTNGKSKFLGVLQELLGDYAGNTSFDTFDAGRRSEASNDLAGLKGKRLVTVIETDEDRRLAEARVKAVTGQDRITCRFLFQEYFTYAPTFKIWLAMNHKPIIRGTDRGIWRRIQLIPFSQSFEGREDQQLADKLRAELPGILNWALEGLAAWRAHGLGTCAAVEAATKAYQRESDLVQQWLDDCVVLDKTARLSTTEAFASFQEWCINRGYHKSNENRFGRAMTEKGFERELTRTQRYYLGLSLIGVMHSTDSTQFPGKSSLENDSRETFRKNASNASHASQPAERQPTPEPLSREALGAMPDKELEKLVDTLLVAGNFDGAASVASYIKNRPLYRAVLERLLSAEAAERAAKGGG